MPTPRLRPKDDVELLKALSLQKGNLGECRVLGDSEMEQGSVLLEVHGQGCRTAAGLWFVGFNVSASGGHYRLWLMEGEWQQYMRDRWFHLRVGGSAKTCVVKRAVASLISATFS